MLAFRVIGAVLIAVITLSGLTLVPAGRPGAPPPDAKPALTSARPTSVSATRLPEQSATDVGAAAATPEADVSGQPSHAMIAPSTGVSVTVEPATGSEAKPFITDSAVSEVEPAGTPTATPVTSDVPLSQWQWLPITRIEIPSIGLTSSVVFAPLIEQDGEWTWQVPAFRVGHAQYTAGAGGAGNAVLIAHVASLNEGEVFQNLHLVQLGDTIRVLSGQSEFDYRVVSRQVVPRTDVAVVQPTQSATVTLITCAGVWVPSLDDYSDRLVVKGELMQ